MAMSSCCSLLFWSKGLQVFVLGITSVSAGFVVHGRSTPDITQRVTKQVLRSARTSENGAFMAVPEAACPEEDSLEFWEGRGHVAKDMLDEWSKQFPGSPVLASTPDVCLVAGEWTDSRVAKTFTLVHKSADDVCNPADSMQAEPHEWRDQELDSVDVTVTTYDVHGPMAELSPRRSYALVLPKKYPCSKRNPCSLIVSLHGLGEHGAPGDEDSIKNLGKTGFLRMATHDESCAAELQSILLVPQILEEESWVKDGPQLLADFVMPLMGEIQDKHVIDPERIGVVGFSEGALGALHCVMRYENVFSLVVAASASVHSWANMTEAANAATSMPPANVPVHSGVPQVSVTLGEKDASGSQIDNMLSILQLLSNQGVLERIRLDVRVLAGVGHNHWEKIFNNWPVFFDAAWKGHFRQ